MNPARRQLLAHMTEGDLQAQIIAAAQTHRWHVAHFRPARTELGWRTPVAADGAGFPDLVLVRNGRLIFAELKSERGRISDAQEAWLARLAEADVEVYVWRPTDLDTALEVLR